MPPLTTPKIEVGSPTSIWVFPGPLDAPLPDYRAQGAWAEVRSGERDFWEDAVNLFIFSFSVRFIPRDTIVYPNGTGAKGLRNVNGVNDILLQLQKNEFKFFPNKDTTTFYICYLLEHRVEQERGGTHFKVEMKIRTKDGTQIRDY